VLFVFQPAEEGTPGDSVSGAELMMKENALSSPRADAVLGLHVEPGPPGRLAWRSGPLLAGSDRLEVRLAGHQTHGAQPWNGTDIISMAADIVQAFNQIAARQVNVMHAPTVLTISGISGGVRYNIIPDDLKMIGTLRSFDPEMRRQVMSKAEQAVGSISARYGGSGKIEWTAPTPGVVNDPKLTASLASTLVQAADGNTASGIDFISGSDDFAYFGADRPILYYMLGIGFPPGTNHSPLFDVSDEGAMEVGVRAQSLTALHFLQQGHGSVSQGSDN